MNILEQIQHAFTDYLQTTFGIDNKIARTCAFTLNVDENKQQFGDLTSNAPLVLGKILEENPRDLAAQMIDSFVHEHIVKLEVAGPGFLNATLSLPAIKLLAQELSTAGETFFKRDRFTPIHNYSIEFISANPTGPLTFGHGRGGIIGDVLGNILAFLGHHVTKEYYINDAGSQMQKLGNSIKIRCQQALGQDVSLPEDAYQGEYIIELAKECLAEFGPSVLDQHDQFFIDYGYKKMLARIQKTLKTYRISFDVWFSERTLHEEAISRALELLAEHGFTYEQEGALWFKATLFGDDKDRVVKKSDGSYTYAAADIAYLLNKAERGFDKLIMVLGQDHHSYAIRLEAIRQALNIKSTLEVILYQLVRMQASGQLVRMSKRAGNIVTLDDVIETVGIDVARFFYLNRKADAQLVFDLDLALKKTDENPVYYVQYAFVRTKSILEKAAAEKALQNVSVADCVHLGHEETIILKKIASLKELLANIENNHQTHLLSYYVLELATLFHRYYSQNRVINIDSIETSRARLQLVAVLSETLRTCLTMLGIECPDKM